MKLRHIILFIFSIAAAVSVNAQLAVGSWKSFASFSTVDHVVDTPHIVYYVTNGQLYSYDKDNEETYNYSTGQRLSDSNITSVYYNYDKDYLVVVYSDSNMDIIDSEDRIYNMPDIRDASIGVIPEINDMVFDGDRIYVATNFGVVVFDDRKKEVVTAGNYGKNMTSVTVIDDTLWLVEGYRFYSADKNKSLTSINSVKLWPMGYTVNDLIHLSENIVVMLSDNNTRITIARVTESDNNIEIINEISQLAGLKNLQRLSDGSLMCHTYNTVYIISPDGTIDSRSVAGTDLEAKKVRNVYETKNIASCRGLKELWLGSDAGLSSYSMEAGGITVISEPARPDNALTFSIIGELVKGKSGAVYAASHGFSHLIGEAVNPGRDEHAFFYINRIKDGVITDLTPQIGEFKVRNRNNQSLKTDPKGFKSGYKVKELPGDPEAIIVGSRFDGYYVFKKGHETVQYDDSTSTMRSILNGYRMQANGMDFDRKGNLWVSQYIYEPKADDKQFHFLSADKVGKWTDPSDWQAFADNADDEYNSHDGVLMACKHSDNIFYIDGGYICSIVVIKTGGTETVDDDQLFKSSNLVDQDGNTFNYLYCYCMLEDNRGRVWIGTDNGVIEITRPDDISGSQFSINHLKVPRRDGTNFADYLLNGKIITAMALDPSDRKWIATVNSGVYLVSENGDEIIEHFDPTNSPLPFYGVYSVACDNENNVYFGTTNGVFMYSSMSAPAREDFSEVYAYPNPVRPEYTGWITITGLMENSLVKIADASGNVFHQATSNGGMLVWDGCDRQGRRVKTGVYYVFASQGAEGMESHGAVTKILVVN